jgi:hypothetical protein
MSIICRIRRLRGWLFKGVTVGSLILFLAVGVLWTRSYFRWDAIDWQRGKYVLQIRSAGGDLAIQRREMGNEEPFWELSHYSILKPMPPKVQNGIPDEIGIVSDEAEFWDRIWWHPNEIFRFAGFAYIQSEPIKYLNVIAVLAVKGCWAMETPYWFWCGITAFLPIIAGTQWFKQLRRSKHGMCRHCGYDLRATPDKCPECGTIPAGIKKVKA